MRRRLALSLPTKILPHPPTQKHDFDTKIATKMYTELANNRKRGKNLRCCPSNSEAEASSEPVNKMKNLTPSLSLHSACWLGEKNVKNGGVGWVFIDI